LGKLFTPTGWANNVIPLVHILHFTRGITFLAHPVCASVTKQYNLVPTKRRWCSAAGRVTAGLAECNGSLPPGG